MWLIKAFMLLSLQMGSSLHGNGLAAGSQCVMVVAVVVFVSEQVSLQGMRVEASDWVFISQIPE
jgi:hypothetical protein